VYSTIIAAKSGETMILDALASIYGQTLPPSEVHIVTDGESPADRVWTDRVRRRFPAAVFLRQPLSGQASAIAFAVRRVHTPYVAFLDCDDLWEPEKQERQIRLLQSEATLDAATCLAVNEWREDGELHRSKPQPSAMFTCTTFRTGAFGRFAPPDAGAGHFVWLYRWWTEARRLGICTGVVPYLGLRRRIHGDNSWWKGNAQAHQDLMSEVRRIVASKRSDM
jgi:glycosyltransferase involved in cell wall biosynthesis